MIINSAQQSYRKQHAGFGELVSTRAVIKEVIYRRPKKGYFKLEDIVLPDPIQNCASFTDPKSGRKLLQSEICANELVRQFPVLKKVQVAFKKFMPAIEDPSSRVKKGMTKRKHDSTLNDWITGQIKEVFGGKRRLDIQPIKLEQSA